MPHTNVGKARGKMIVLCLGEFIQSFHDLFWVGLAGGDVLARSEAAGHICLSRRGIALRTVQPIMRKFGFCSGWEFPLTD